MRQYINENQAVLKYSQLLFQKMIGPDQNNNFKNDDYDSDYSEKNFPRKKGEDRCLWEFEGKMELSTSRGGRQFKNSCLFVAHKNRKMLLFFIIITAYPRARDFQCQRCLKELDDPVTTSCCKENVCRQCLDFK